MTDTGMTEEENVLRHECGCIVAINGSPYLSLCPLHRSAPVLAAENERLKDVLHLDRSGLAHALNEVKATVEGYGWIGRGEWGSYSYEERTAETLQAEVARMQSTIEDTCRKALDSSGNLAHAECCGRQPRKHPLQEENAKLHQRVAELEGAMKALDYAADAYAADQGGATDKRCGLVQPVTVEEANELNAALRARMSLKLHSARKPLKHRAASLGVRPSELMIVETFEAEMLGYRARLRRARLVMPELLSGLMIRLGVSLRQLSAVLAVSPTYLSGVRSEKMQASPELICRLANAALRAGGKENKS